MGDTLSAIHCFMLPACKRLLTALLLFPPGALRKPCREVAAADVCTSMATVTLVEEGLLGREGRGPSPAPPLPAGYFWCFCRSRLQGKLAGLLPCCLLWAFTISKGPFGHIPLPTFDNTKLIRHFSLAFAAFAAFALLPLLC